jgi:hypothetical protein
MANSKKKVKEWKSTDVWNLLLCDYDTTFFSTNIIRTIGLPPESWYAQQLRAVNSTVDEAYSILLQSKDNADSESDASSDSSDQQDPSYMTGTTSITDPQYTKPVFSEMINSLVYNHIFDIGFYGSNTINYHEGKNCSCPCSSYIHQVWREKYNIVLSGSDSCCNANPMHTASLLDHLVKSRGWYHQAIYMYLKKLFLPIPYVKCIDTHWLFSDKNGKTTITRRLKNNYDPVRIYICSQTIYDSELSKMGMNSYLMINQIIL